MQAWCACETHFNKGSETFNAIVYLYLMILRNVTNCDNLRLNE